MSAEFHGEADLLSLIDFHFDDEIGFTELDDLE